MPGMPRALGSIDVRVACCIRTGVKAFSLFSLSRQKPTASTAVWRTLQLSLLHVRSFLYAFRSNFDSENTT